MRLIGMVPFLILSVTNLYAQFNDSTFYLVKYSTTGIVNRTNENNSFAFSNAVRFGMSKNRIALNSNSNWVYGQQQGRLTNNDFATAADFNWFTKKRKFYYWGLGTYETSYSLKVNNRTQAGLGGAYNFVDTKGLFINISNGILYEFAALKLTDSTNDVYSTFRNSFRFRFYYVFNERVVIDHVSFLQNSLSQQSDYIINTNTSISFKLAKWISLTSALKYNKVSRNKRDNLLVTFGLTAEKYF